MLLYPTSYDEFGRDSSGDAMVRQTKCGQPVEAQARELELELQLAGLGLADLSLLASWMFAPSPSPDS